MGDGDPEFAATLTSGTWIKEKEFMSKPHLKQAISRCKGGGWVLFNKRNLLTLQRSVQEEDSSTLLIRMMKVATLSLPGTRMHQTLLSRHTFCQMNSLRNLWNTSSSWKSV